MRTAPTGVLRRRSMERDTLLELRGIRMRFGAVEALRGIDLSIGAGEVVGLLGDNGAGKSTLIKIIAGVHAPTSGEVRFEGKTVRSFMPDHARQLGIETIYQDLALAGNLDVAANIFLGRELKTRVLGLLPIADRGRMRKEAQAATRRLGIHIPAPRAPVQNLSGGQQQSVAVARAVYWKARLVIMDEPTAALGVAEHDMVLDLIQELGRQGVSVIFITHTMQDALRTTDRLVVLTRGTKALESDTGEVSEEDVVSAMLVGSEGGRA